MENVVSYVRDLFNKNQVPSNNPTQRISLDFLTIKNNIRSNQIHYFEDVTVIESLNNHQQHNPKESSPKIEIKRGLIIFHFNIFTLI